MRSTGNEQFSVYVYYKTNENNELINDEEVFEEDIVKGESGEAEYAVGNKRTKHK